jgi:ankyrin repeat protein
MMIITGNKDMDLIVLSKLFEKEFFIFCSFKNQNKYINKLYNNETLWRERLFRYYAEIYPEENQTWKNLYLSLIYHLDKFEYKKNKKILMKATMNDHLDVVKYLMSLSKEYEIRTNAVEKSFEYACKTGFLNIVKYLMSLHGIIKANLDYNYAIRLASEYGHLDVVKYLMSLPKEYKIDPSAKNNYAIRLASEYGHLDVVKYLIGLPQEYGINPAAQNNEAIKMASAHGHLKVVKYLMSLPEEYKINPATEDNWAISAAIDNNCLDVVKYLMSLPKEYGIDPSENHKLEIIDYLIKEYDVDNWIISYKNKSFQEYNKIFQ